MIYYVKLVGLDTNSSIILHAIGGGMPQFAIPKNRQEWCEGFYTDFGLIRFGAIDEILTTEGFGWKRIWKREAGR